MLAADLRFQLIDLKRFELEAPPGFEPGMEVLQTSALPLGDGAVLPRGNNKPAVAGSTRRAGASASARSAGFGETAFAWLA